MRRPSRGVVTEFDEDRGLGTVRDEVGRDLPFHCTAIADGTRSIAPGTKVTFLTAPGHLGRTEARGLLAAPAADPTAGPPGPGTDDPAPPPAGSVGVPQAPVATPPPDGTAPGGPPASPPETTTVYRPPPAAGAH
jgi:cold shock CspA family protein